MFQLPIPNKRITWFFSIFFTILFLFVFYRFDSMGYGMYEKSIEQFFVTFDGSIEDMLEYEIIVPLYKNFEDLNYIYLQVKNISQHDLKKLKMYVNEFDDFQTYSTFREKNLIDHGLLLSEILESNYDEKFKKNIIYDLQPGSEALQKIHVFGESFSNYSFEMEFSGEDWLYIFKSVQGFDIYEDKNNSIKMELLPFLLLSPFSTAIFPVTILFLGYLFEAMLLDRKYGFDELRFLIRNISNSFFYFLYKIKVKFRKIRKKTIPVDEDKKKKEWIIDKELQVIWRFIGMYFFSIIILYTLFSWYIVSFWYLSPLLIIFSVVGILLIVRILYSKL